MSYKGYATDPWGNTTLVLTPEAQGAIEGLREAIDRREDFRAAHYDDDAGEPTCGYPKWDERMFDFALEISEAAEGLMDALDAK